MHKRILKIYEIKFGVRSQSRKYVNQNNSLSKILFRSTMKVANRFDSQVVRANAWHHRSDETFECLVYAETNPKQILNSNI